MTEAVHIKAPAIGFRRLSPHELREATIRDYRAAAERAGLAIDLAELERQAVRDCEMADRFNATASVRARAVKPPDAKARRTKIEGDLAKNGVALVEPGEVKRAPIATMHSAGGTDRWQRAKGRCIRIMAGATSHPNRAVAFSTCELPHLAFALWRVQCDLIASRVWRPRPGDEPNEFYGLSAVDKSRLLQRKIEDICDLSTGRLGPWRTPK